MVGGNKSRHLHRTYYQLGTILSVFYVVSAFDPHCSPVTDHLLQSSEPEVSSETYQGELERVVGMLGALYNFLLSAAHQPKASEPCTMGVSAIWG